MIVELARQGAKQSETVNTGMEFSFNQSEALPRSG